MAQNHLSTYIIPSEDEHQSEYTSIKDQRREYISGFTGSSGIAIVTITKAALSTDSRYFIQAREQIDHNWLLLRQGIDENWIDWMINESLELENPAIGVDPRLITWKLGNTLVTKCHANNLPFVIDLESNLIDLIKPKITIPLPPIYHFDFKYSGMHTSDKLSILRNQMKIDDCGLYISSMLDSIAWLLNLRGDDIVYNPVFFAYLIISMNDVTIYVDKRKISSNIATYLSDLGIAIKSYNLIWDDLPALKINHEQKICIENNASFAIYLNLPLNIYDYTVRSMVTELKGIKNDIEIENLHLSQRIDSLSIIRLFSWLDKSINQGLELNELDVVDKLLEFRSKSPHFKGLSFSTIAASAENSAIVHYEPTSDNFSNLKTNNLLLLDSGGQYFQGTTDITRTHYIRDGKKKSSPTPEMKKCYTLVLAGHLNIAMLKFQYGTTSKYIDSLGRSPLLKHGMNYGHGTGHGIDNFINVHSGPCGLSPGETSYNYMLLEAGNFLSDEPGVYKEGQWGVRIESDVLVIENDDGDDDDDNDEKAGNTDLKFEYLTLVPFCIDLLNVKYLDARQINWINEYHSKVRNEYKEDLSKEEYDWLCHATREIQV